MLTTRILTGIVLGVLVTGLSLYGSTAAFAAILGLLWLVGVWEWSRLAGLTSNWRLLFALVHVLLMAYFFWRGFQSTATVVAIWFSLVATLLAIVSMQRFPRVFPPTGIAFLGLVSLVPSWLAIAYLHALDPGLSLAAIVIVWGADVGAYAAGRSFGRHKLAPSISPGKTWEGVAGGLFAALIVAALTAWRLELPSGFVAIAIVAAAVSVLGDLDVSMLKRHAGLKDSGRLLPGHGGALDRIDGLTTGLPIIAIGLQFARVLD